MDRVNQRRSHAYPDCRRSMYFDNPCRLPIDSQDFSIIQTLLPLVVPAMASSRPLTPNLDY
jgi:hypothetical protein